MNDLSFNQYRKAHYKKDEKQENFLDDFNNYLLNKEQYEYEDFPLKYPFIFVIGAPRSGTTLLTQLIANTFDISYINNLAARFFLSPLHGIRFSKSVLGDNRNSAFQSDYARTYNLSDIHEFGYFWKYWLEKHTVEDIVQSKSNEEQINWTMVKNILATLQKETNRPFIFKNIYGSYHMEKLISLLKKVIWVYIERDQLDTAVSILNARKKYNTDLNVWWSYYPLEYNKIKDLDYWSQIAGQIHYLQKFYKNEFEKLPRENYLKVTYKEMCTSPYSIIDKIKSKCAAHGFEIPLANQIPENFPYKTYNDADEQKRIFRDRFERFQGG